MAEGRAEAEQLLEADGKGTLCARRLSDLQDEIIRAIHDFAVAHVYPIDNRSSAERMAIVAVGGYGRGTLAPGSDIDLLFLLPYKQTPWGESVIEFILYMLWDLGLKVGHATRSVDECIRLARSDMTIRTAILEARYICGDEALFDELVSALRHRGRQGHRPGVHRRQAGRARRAPSPAGRLALPGRAQRQGRQGRPARPPHAVLDRQVFLPRPDRRGAGQGRRLLAAPSCRCFQKAEDFLWAVRCHLHFLTGRAEERLTFDLQREMAARLGYTDASRPARTSSAS